MTDWKPICRGAVGIEFHTWQGFGAGRDLFHRYACGGVVTVYVSAQPLRSFLSMIAKARAALKENG